jgi:hypothetical protein
VQVKRVCAMSGLLAAIFDNAEGLTGYNRPNLQHYVVSYRLSRHRAATDGARGVVTVARCGSCANFVVRVTQGVKDDALAE